MVFFGYAVKSFYIFLAGEKENRLPLYLFFICHGSIIQIILSTLEIELIPLSGISLPFMSIGFTAMILLLTYGLFVGMNMTIKKLSYSK